MLWGTIRSAKKERRRPKISRPRFLPKGIVSLYKKLLVSTPLCFGKAAAVIVATAFVSFRALRRSKPNPPKTERSILPTKIYV